MNTEKNETAGFIDLNTTIPAQALPDQPAHQAFLRKLGLTEEEIRRADAEAAKALEKQQRRTQAKNLAGQIRQHREQIVAINEGRSFLNADEVHKGLVAEGVSKEGEKTNGVGGALGQGRGLHLPSRSVNGRRYYDLTQIDASPAEREAAQANLNALSKPHLRAAARIN